MLCRRVGCQKCCRGWHKVAAMFGLPPRRHKGCYYSKADVRITANDQTPGSAGYSLFCFVHEKEV